MASQQQPGSSTKLLSPFDQRIYDVPEAQAERYRQSGWVAPATDVSDSEVHSSLSSWREQSALESAAWSASHGWLGLPFVIEKGAHALGHDDWAQQYAQRVQEAEAQHPMVDAGARLVGNIGSVAAYTALAAPAAAGIAGLFGAGAAAGAGAATAAGAGAVGAAAAGAAGATGAAGAAAATGIAGSVVANAAAAAAAAPALSLGARALQAAPAIGRAAATLAAEGAAIGIVDRYDQAAIAHAATPEGREKIVWSLSDIARDAAVSAGAGLTFGAVAKGLTSLGKKLEGGSTNYLINSVTSRISREQIADQGREAELRMLAKDVLPKGLNRARVDVDNIVNKAEKDMNQVKHSIQGPLDAATPKEISDLKAYVATTLAGKKEATDILKHIDSEVAANGKLGVQSLQEIRRGSNDLINWADFKGRDVNPAIRDVGLQLGKNISNILTRADGSLGTQYAAQWTTLDKSYSAAQLLQSALRSGQETPTLAATVGGIVKAGAVGAVVGSTGFMGGTMAAGKASAGFKALQSVKPEHFAELGQKLGGVMSHADRTLSSTIVRNLRGVPAMVTNAYSPAQYQDTAAKLAEIGSNPTKAASNINQALTTAGIPDDMAQDMTGALHAQNMYLADQLKQQTGPADMPSQGHGDPVKMRQVMGQAQTMQSPDYGIDNPTQANLEVLKKFYPNTLIAAQAAIYQQLRTNPKMSQRTKMWASRVLGRPISNLSGPGFSAMLQQSRAAGAAQQQAGASKPRRSSGSTGDDVGAQTRLDELQGGG